MQFCAYSSTSPPSSTGHWTAAARAPAFLLSFGLALFAGEPGNERTIPDAPGREPWTTSRLVGSPDPPAPYAVRRVFAGVELRNPLYVAPEPGTGDLFVVLAGGEKDRPSRILRLPDDPDTRHSSVALEVERRLVYSVSFHPRYEENGLLFVFTNGPTGEDERTNRITRHHASRDAARRVDPHGQTILEWRSAGHDGGDLGFAPDGLLYITTGDGTSDSDGWSSGQTVDDLLGSVLRIDVDHPGEGVPYSVPPDNPFVKLPGARPEVWAYGLRNPWRLGIDLPTGQIWVGNNGQDLWETAHLARSGENYGWSVYEGSHPFYLNRKHGPTPLVPPTIEQPHALFRSLTGGVVYRGSRFPELDGAYLYGDYATGRIWGMRHDGARVLWHRELADTTLAIAAFRVDQRGEILVVDHSGHSLFQLEPAPPTGKRPPFPLRLSETGLFASTRDQTPARGVLPYFVNAAAWTDGAAVERFLAVPGGALVEYSSGPWGFPDGTALVQTLSLEAPPGVAASRRRVETRVLLRQEGEWAGYSYRWSPDGADAELVPAGGADAEFDLAGARGQGTEPGGVGRGGTQAWRFPAREECMACHSRAASYVLGITEGQLNRTLEVAGGPGDQIHSLVRRGLFRNPPDRPAEKLERLVDPGDTTAPLEPRARAYLQVNCSVCHVEAGGGNSAMELGLATARDKMRLLGARPRHDTFGLPDAMLVAPGNPDRSVLLRRLSRRGTGQMPPLVTRRVDEQAVELFKAWISSLEPPRRNVRTWTPADFLPLDDNQLGGRSFERGQAVFRELGCSQCHHFGAEGGSVGPDLTGIGKRQTPTQVLESILDPSRVIPEEFATLELELEGGNVAAGRVEIETQDEVVLRPAAFGEAPVHVKKSNILRRWPSGVSSMPAGIVNTLEREEVLDLLAYTLGSGTPERRVAALVTVYRRNSHADVIVSRLFQTDTLDGKGKASPLKLASLYVDQEREGDLGRSFAATYGFPVFETVEGALTLGTGKLAVEGVLLVAEHGDYPRSPTGNTQYPKRRLWDQMLAVFRSSGKVVPVFVDKHLADNWEDAKHIHDTARELQIPLMAGSSVPGSWREPPGDVDRDAKLAEIVALTFHTTDAYGFHALEVVQALAEQRRGGETGIRSVQCLGGEAVWAAQAEGKLDAKLFQAAWSRLPRHLEGDRTLREAVRDPKLLLVEYRDGLRAALLELNGAVGEWTAAWRYEEAGRIESTQLWTQEGRPAAHFTLLLNGIERMMLTGRPSWNVERTLLTSGALDALLRSYAAGGVKLETPYLDVTYRPTWRWRSPPPPPPGGPW